MIVANVGVSYVYVKLSNQFSTERKKGIERTRSTHNDTDVLYRFHSDVRIDDVL